jgi:GH35 family endo-1,4-beta-xylanase
VGLAAVALLLAASAAQAQPPRAFFGVTPQRHLEDADFSRMAEAKSGTLRFELHWAGIEPAQDAPYDWSSSDRTVAEAARNGIRALPFAYATPDWVAALDGRDCPNGCGTFAPAGKAALAEWREFLEAAVRRYGPGGEFWAVHPDLHPLPIRDWQIWNEQNSPAFYAPKPSIADYAKLLHAARRAITSEDTGAEIILGGMFGTPQGGLRPAIAAQEYLSKLYDRGAERDFDGVAPHPYAPRYENVVAQVESIRATMKEAKDGHADLWITEIGWASDGPATPLNRGPRGQAERLEQAFKYFVRNRKRLNVRNVDWYSWRDDSSAGAGLCEWCPYSGLFDDDLEAKPALKAFTKFTGGS